MPEHKKLRPVKFTEAIEALRRRLSISEATWDALVAGAELGARAVADETTNTMVESFIRAIISILDEGGTLADFRRDYDAITQKHGWKSPKGAGWHSELIFRLHVSNARNAGRWQQIQRVKKFRPYIRYVTVGDHRVRDTHALWHGVILPIEHPFWLSHLPPNGFNCRCYVQSVSERDLQRYGWTLTDPGDPLLSVPPDEGWSGNVGIANAALAAGS